jgi:hypothetical protein
VASGLVPHWACAVWHQACYETSMARGRSWPLSLMTPWKENVGRMGVGSPGRTYSTVVLGMGYTFFVWVKRVGFWKCRHVCRLLMWTGCPVAIKIWTFCVGSSYSFIITIITATTCFTKIKLLDKPCMRIKLALCKANLNLFLELSLCMYSFILFRCRAALSAACG